MLSGYFPDPAVAAVPAHRFVLGRRIVREKMRRDLPWLLGLGVVLIVVGLAIAYAARTHAPSAVVGAYVSQLSFSPDSFSMIIFQTGMVLLVYGSVLLLRRHQERQGESQSDPEDLQPHQPLLADVLFPQ